MRRIAIRADSSRTIGFGHISRCLNLAHAFREAGDDVVFVSRDFPGANFEAIQRLGFNLRVLKQENHAGGAEIDAQRTIRAVEREVDWAIVDCYDLDATWERAMRKAGCRVLAIDDVRTRTHDCDAILDQNYLPNLRSRYFDSCPDGSICLLGPRYALLADEFRKARATLGRRRFGSTVHLLVSFGGSDPANETMRVLEGIEGLIHDRKIAVTVAIGPMNAKRSEIEAWCRAHPRAVARFNGPMHELMANATLAIGGGGTSSWERCCFGLPCVVSAIALNQIETSAALGRWGAIAYLGETANVETSAYASTVSRLLDRPQELAEMGAKASALVDGEGARRVVEALKAWNIRIRPASIEDVHDVWSWRNDETTRQMSIGTAPISLDSHREWFQRSLTNEGRRILIGCLGQEKIGLCRFDIGSSEARVSINLNPTMRGRRLSIPLLEFCVREFFKNHGEPLRAEVRKNNSASLRCFESCGFRIESSDDEFVRFRRYRR